MGNNEEGAGKTHLGGRPGPGRATARRLVCGYHRAYRKSAPTLQEATGKIEAKFGIPRFQIPHNYLEPLKRNDLLLREV